MFVVMNRIPVRPGFGEAFEDRFRQRAGAVDRMPGFIRTMVLRPENDEDPYVVLTMWESKEHYIAWTQSEAFQQGHSRPGRLPQEAYRGPSRLETFSTVVDSAQEREDGQA